MPHEATPPSPAAEAECHRLCHFLVGGTPPPSVVEAYGRAREAVAPGPGPAPIDRVLIQAAELGEVGVALADAYAAHFRRSTLLRHRLTLLCAILESSPPYHGRVTRGRLLSPGGALATVVIAVLRHGVLLLAAMLVFGPVHLVGGRRAGPLAS